MEETPPLQMPVGPVEDGDENGEEEEEEREEQEDSRLFIDLGAAGANVGFRQWHPAAVTGDGDGVPAGQAGLGGVWEWTSSPLRRHEGFEPAALYPAYTGESRLHHSPTYLLTAYCLVILCCRCRCRVADIATFVFMNKQRTSSTRNTTSSSAARGRLTRGSRGGRHCKGFPSSSFK